MDARKNYLTMKTATDLFRKTIPPEIMKDLLLDNVEVKEIYLNMNATDIYTFLE